MLVNVDLNRDGNITDMDDSLLTKKEGVDHHYDTDGTLHDKAEWVEYWLGEKLVHRSAHVTVYKQPAFGEGIAGSFGLG